MRDVFAALSSFEFFIDFCEMMEFIYVAKQVLVMQIIRKSVSRILTLRSNGSRLIDGENRNLKVQLQMQLNNTDIGSETLRSLMIISTEQVSRPELVEGYTHMH